MVCILLVVMLFSIKKSICYLGYNSVGIHKCVLLFRKRACHFSEWMKDESNFNTEHCVHVLRYCPMSRKRCNARATPSYNYKFILVCTHTWKTHTIFWLKSKINKLLWSSRLWWSPRIWVTCSWPDITTVIGTMKLTYHCYLNLSRCVCRGVNCMEQNITTVCFSCFCVQ